MITLGVIYVGRVMDEGRIDEAKLRGKFYEDLENRKNKSE